MVRSEPQTIFALIDGHAERHPDALAVALRAEAITYEKLSTLSMTAARWLRDLGVGRGDRVAIMIANVDCDYIALSIGAMRLGAIAVCVNNRYKSAELAYLLAKSSPTVLLASPRYAELIQSTQIPPGCAVILRDGGDVLGDVTLRTTQAEIEDMQQAVDPDAAARIIFTSGTTANPKGCVHSQRAMLHQGRSVARRLNMRANDRFWTPLPMFHTAGWSSLLAALASGASLHHPGYPDFDASVAQLAENRCTIAFPGFETIWVPILDRIVSMGTGLPALRLVIIVGVEERLRSMQQILPNAIQVANTGSTEACGWLAIGSPDDDVSARLTTCGQVLDDMEIRLIDPATGDDADPAQGGEMLFRGPARLLEYFEDPEGTASAIDADGWFHSGDLLRATPEGRLVFVSRLKDMLKVGGENVAAAEIESHLLRLAGIRFAQVVAVPDAYYGEVAAAFIELEEGFSLDESRIIAHCTDQIASFKVPRHVFFVTEWPMSGTKVRKVDLRQEAVRKIAARSAQT